MSIIQFPSARHQITNRFGNLEITIPSVKQWAFIALLIWWLTLWACSETFTGIILFGGLVGLLTQNSPADLINLAPSVGFYFDYLFFLVWFTIWTVWTYGGAKAFYMLLWSLAGEEVIEVNRAGIMIRQQIFGYGPGEAYLANYIKGLRISPPSYNPRHLRYPAGIIVFDYGAKTLRFGNGVDEAEAKLILAEIKTRFPQYNRGIRAIKRRTT